MKKFLLGMGTIAASVIPAIAVISCGENSTPETPEEKVARLEKNHEQQLTTKLNAASTFLTNYQINAPSMEMPSTYSNVTISNVFSRVFGITTSPDELQGITLENITVTPNDVGRTLQVDFTLKIESQTKTFTRVISGFPRAKTQAELDAAYITGLPNADIYKGKQFLTFQTTSNVSVSNWQNDDDND